MARFIDMTGRKFGRLTAIRYVGGRKWACHCVCGIKTVVLGADLRAGRSLSCGRHRLEKIQTHGCATRENKTPEYRAWNSMRQRCNNPNNPKWKDYGGRGIKVCSRWDDFGLFIQDMGCRPSARHSIDRIDNDGNYEPSNCRWATRSQQSKNQRRRLRDERGCFMPAH
jgi:hypothetical protein